MDSLAYAAQSLAQQLREVSPKQGEIVCLCVTLKASLDGLQWLKAQHEYPQFYLTLRDCEKSYAAIGALRQFDSLDGAQNFIENTNFPLVGGLTFVGRTQFILPRILLEQSGETCQVSLFVEGNHSHEALAALEGLAQSQSLVPVAKVCVRQKRFRASPARWENWINQALDSIAEGKMSKLVLANETTFELESSLNPYDFLAESRQLNKGCYHFLWRQTADSTFLGSTPERLFARDGLQLHTEALAGTAPIGEDANAQQRWAQWLLNDDKNRLENELVVQDIAHNLQAWLATWQVADVAIKPLRTVQHLVRKISAELISSCRDADILALIHPTAAVAGLPQQAAKQRLQEIETFERDWYAGTLGLMSREQAEFCVTIRSAFIEQQQIRVFAGAGIVAGSDPLAEWKEIERKAAGLISLFATDNGEEK